MRIFYLVLAIVSSVALIYTLDTRQVLPAPLGKLLSPNEGIWMNAESVHKEHGGEWHFPGLKGRTEVYLDSRLVPHIFAEQEGDAYFVQGWLHAKYRLWQMEFQTHAAAGRISEIVGPRAVSYDRQQRRMGMVYAAENALYKMEQDPETKAMLDAYTAGVNAYIEKLQLSELPVEYKLLGYKPEKWTNLKSALFIKAMTNDLAGFDRDFEFTHALQVLGEKNFRLLYPEVPDSLSPIIPKGTSFDPPVSAGAMPVNADSAYFHRTDSNWIFPDNKPDPSNGSNNWAVAGTKTKSGHPILSNDPHLRLSLPAIWYEIQIHTPDFNAYGVSFPGIPGVVIGFNSDIAFGFTNSGRDVRDYYEITFRDEKRSAYLFNKEWKPTVNRIEEIRVRDSLTVLDTVSYTVFGPVMYDRSMKAKLSDSRAYALRWVAHDTSNILKMWHLLNHAKNYDDYLSAIRHFNVPGQSMLFASRSGDIALWQQAAFPLRWKDQGLFVMPGTDSSYMWKGFIPQEHNPHVVNPSQGFISSANQRPVDAAYPYFIPGSYDVYRGIIINRRLSQMDKVTPDDMMRLQNDNYNVFAEYARPIILKNTDSTRIGNAEKYYLEIFRKWNLRNDPEQKGPTVFSAIWDSLHTIILQDDLNTTAIPVIRPDKFVLLEGLLRDTNFTFIDDIRTPEKETLADMVTRAVQLAARGLDRVEKEGKLTWGSFKNTSIYHLLRDNAKPFARIGLINGGGDHIINATKHDHGPSWRMVVHMSNPIEAHVVYPGGQDGNPGSKNYDNFVDTWTKGEYYKAWFMTEDDKTDRKAIWKMVFTK